MIISKLKYILMTLIALVLLSTAVNAKEINLFDGLIKIRTYDNNDNRRTRHEKDERTGHYEIRRGRLIWVEEINRDDREDHIIDDEPEEWVLLTRIQNDNFDWVIIPTSKRHKIKKFLKRGYHRSMTGRKKSCYRMGQKKERLWAKHHMFWQ